MEKFLIDLADSNNGASQIDKELFDKYNVKRGLRNSDGSGVLVGLTNVGDVQGYIPEDGKLIPIEGNLFYRGYSVKGLVEGFQDNGYLGFDETTFLLLTGKLPTKKQLDKFSKYIGGNRDLEETFTNMILSLKGKDIMNMLARSVLILYNLDDKAEDYSHENQIRQSLMLIAKLPTIVAYSYSSMRHKYYHENLVIRHPKAELSPAENLLYMLKGEKYSKIDAEILDLAMILHAEHGGGNNSSFTMRLVSSAMTDTYSATAAAIGSLKGSLHGGANLKVLEMMENFKMNIINWDDETEVKEYLKKTLVGQTFDNSGKIYGLGHAIYTLSDPRAVLLKKKAVELAKEKGLEKLFNLYELVERLAPVAFEELKGSKKTISANVDFYSGFVYEAIGIPRELFTPIFAISRMSGWAAHRMEEMTFSSRRIIRPAYKNVGENEQKYIPMEERIDEIE